jgi:tRNA (mo5U34)-methyltransferase
MSAQPTTELEHELRALAPWHFEMEVVPGISTISYNKETYGNIDHERVGIKDPYEMKPLFEVILPDGGMAGKTLLDVGCNAGGYCFVAHELGAAACYGFDVRDHWIRQAEFIKSIKYPGCDNIRFNVADVKQFAHEQQYDVALFKGIFYHLPDPISTLAKICSLTRRAIIVDSASRSDIPGDCMVPWWESTTHVMSGVDGFAWFPGGPEVVGAILKWSGFPHMRVVFQQKGNQAERFRGRFRVIAARDERDLASYDTRRN